MGTNVVTHASPHRAVAFNFAGSVAFAFHGVGAPPPPSEGTFWNFDFGNSDPPVDGWIRIRGNDGTESQTDYDPELGYGWTFSHFNNPNGHGILERDRTDPSEYPLLRYLCATENARFRMDVENGSYTVRIVSGDSVQMHDDLFVWVNDVYQETFSLQEDEFVIKEYNVTVTEGYIDLHVRDGHDYLNLGEDFYFVLNAVQVFPQGANVPPPEIPDPPPPPDIPEPPTEHTNMLVFGPPNTPVAEGWTLIPYTTRYNASLGCGYIDNTFVRDYDRGTGVDSVRYFAVSSDMTFRIDVDEPGVYLVTCEFGDATAGHDQEIYIDYLRVDIQTYTANTPVTVQYNVPVYGDHFLIQMFGSGKPSFTDINATLHSITYELTATPLPEQPFQLKFDFGDWLSPPPNAPTATGYTKVVKATMYSEGGYGWLPGAVAMEDRWQGYIDDYLLSNDLLRTYNLMTDGTFKCTLPNGNYTVKVISGEIGSPHDFYIYMQGALVATKNLVAEEFTDDEYSVTVSDGTFTIRLLETAAPTNYALLNALIITADD